MKKIYLLFFTVLFFCAVLPGYTNAQNCAALTAAFKAYESRCTATGAIKIAASGGSGMYKYKVTGQMNINFTSVDSITGLSAGSYTLIVNDITTNCSLTIPNIVVPGTYRDPRFTLNTFDVTCDNGINGKITLGEQSYGRSPFRYSIVAPSATGIGTTNSTGTFTNLPGGTYTIRMSDSCGGIQTRLVTINNYTWKIDSVKFRKTSCDSALGTITASDSKNNISTAGGIPGFLYGVVRRAGDTIWSPTPNFSFYLAGQNSFDVVVKDACGKVKNTVASVSFKPAMSAFVNMFAFTCNKFSAAATGVVNFFNPQFCIYDSTGAEISCNSTGRFTNLAYGRYCIRAHDACTDTTIIRCFSSSAPPVSIDNTVDVSNKTCVSFTAAITGQIGLTSPNYCLYDSHNNRVSCNTTGLFNNVAYGSYCITARDSCRDTTLRRCFTAVKPVPRVPPVLYPGYLTCYNFGVVVRGDSLTNPRFCIADSSGAILRCNYTGIFDSLRYGNYCITIYDACYDTTITRCIGVFGPRVVNDINISFSNKVCTNFTATVSTNNLIAPDYCLYNSANVLVGCNTSGIFNNLPYGSYCAAVHNSCPDTIFNSCFTITGPRPMLSASVIVSNRTCATFSVSTTGMQNFTNPAYCVYNRNNVKLTCNTTGIFDNIPYGFYCIQVKDGCYDTTVTRCFTISPVPLRVSVTSKKSCNYGFARLSISVTGALMPLNIKVVSPDGRLFYNGNYNTSTVNIDSVPGTLSGDRFKIIASDNCGNKDTVNIATVPSIVVHKPLVVPKCPGSLWLDGSGSIAVTASSNTGSLTLRIIKKNTVALSSFIAPDSAISDRYVFNNLGPGKYIIRYKANDACNKYFYDTVTIKPYQYPNLDRSTAYQCDANGFSIGAVVSNGVAPFTYEVIGSSPDFPSVITPPQPSPIFNINNGSTYSLIRLRALDACGNASLEDASILPLANNGIISTYNCFQIYTTLRVDTLYNSSYSWYLKHTKNGSDSIYLASGFSIYLPNVTPSDTGLYVCHLSVNNGCIKRTYYYRLDGSCSHYLPVALEDFTGRYAGSRVQLNWKMAADENVKRFIIERKNNEDRFVPVGYINAVSNSMAANYLFTDTSAAPLKNAYRLKVMNRNNSFTFSNEILISRGEAISGVSIYPNPVHDVFTVDFNKVTTNHTYKINLINLFNQVVKEADYNASSGKRLQISRPKESGSGIYVVKLFDLDTGEEFSQKVIFQ